MSGAGSVRAGGAFVEIFAKDGKFQQAISRVQKKLRDVSKSMRQFGTQSVMGGAALGTPFAAAAGEAASFTLAMAQVKANTGATEEQFAKLNKAAREMGVSMGRTPTETANAMSELAKAGLDAEGVMKSVGPVLALAASDNMELSRAVEVVVGTMSQFGMTTNDFSTIADRLQAAANASTTSVDLIGESLSYVGPQAQMAGQSFDEVAAALGALAQGGIKGSMAGTQLARVIESMAAEEGKFNALGVSVRDTTGNLRPFMDVLRDMGKATAGMNNADRLQAFMDVFDIRGARAASTLSQLGGEFDRILGTIQNSSGAAASKAAQVLDSFGGQVQVLTAKFADLKVALITSVGGAATTFVRGLGNVLSLLAKFAEQNPRIVATVAILAGGLIAIGAAAIVASVAIKAFGVALAAVTYLSNPVGLALLAIVAVIAAVVAAARTLSPAFEGETNAIMAALMDLDFGKAWSIMNVDFAIALTEMAKAADGAGRYIFDSLIEGLDRFMGLFGADIITLQNSWERLGVYFRAAFDWKWATDGMQAALDEADRRAEEARKNAPTADARSAQRTADRTKEQAKWDGTLEQLRQERAQLTAPKPAAAAAESTGDPAEAVRKMVEAAAIGGATSEADSSGSKSSRSFGGFGSGAGLGLGAEADLVTPAKQTAANTAIAAQALQQIAGSGAGIGGGAASPAASAATAAAPGVQDGVRTAAAVDVASAISAMRDAVVGAIREHIAATQAGNKSLERIASKMESGAAAFA